MSNRELGRLEEVKLREQWEAERDFSGWLTKPKNLEILGETLGIDLEVESVEVEKPVGPFRADILCKDTGTDSDTNADYWVLIENQLERTDHDHLGKLLTYAAGLNAVTVVWLAAPFRDEHRAALDWLNSITREDFRFFGLEIELWKIGDSDAAPKFNIVSQPNDWSRSVARRAKATDDAELSEKRLKQREYWSALQEMLNSVGGPVAGDGNPKPRNWMSYRIGRGGMHLSAVMNSSKNWIRAEFYVYGENAKERFKILKPQKDEIERELGYSLEWEELPTKQPSRIAYYLRDVDLWDEADWPRQHKWLAENLNKMLRVFTPRVQKL